MLTKVKTLLMMQTSLLWNITDGVLPAALHTQLEIVLPFPENRSTCFPPHGESLTHMHKSPDHVFPLAHMHKSFLTQMHKSPTEAEFTCSRAPEPSDCTLFNFLEYLRVDGSVGLYRHVPRPSELPLCQGLLRAD